MACCGLNRKPELRCLKDQLSKVVALYPAQLYRILSFAFDGIQNPEMMGLEEFGSIEKEINEAE